MKDRHASSRQRAHFIITVLLLGLAFAVTTSAEARAAGTRFEISFPSTVHAEPITGRVFVMISKKSTTEPRLQAGSWQGSVPFYGADVDQLKPGATAVIDSDTPGYPVRSLTEIPAGDYYVQALINKYTEFHRSDGHTIWAHMDQWEGQQFNRSPGNLISEVQKIHLDPAAGYTVKLSLSKVIPPIDIPADTAWVKRIKIQSKLLTKFWGHPMYLGATVLLPKGYNERTDVRYRAIYVQGHFGLEPPFLFRTDNSESEAMLARLRSVGIEGGYEFYQKWNAEDFPRVIAVTFQHPTPFFDDSYAVNSANNGPYGDAILTELIPYVEQHLRIIRKPYARVLTGGSTGGWESLALQVYHPDFFGGTWTFYPDPIDFRRYGIANIYDDESAFSVRDSDWMIAERPLMRTPDGQVHITNRQMSQLEAVLGSRGRSCQQLEAWEAVYGPVGEDGYPKPLWDKQTGKIDKEVAKYMREHGYDLRHYIETNWPKIGPKLVGKIHLYCGDMDHFYLNLSVYLLEDFLRNTKQPYYAGSFDYGRPMKGHGWQPMSNAELVRMMAEHIRKNTPKDEAVTSRH